MKRLLQFGCLAFTALAPSSATAASAHVHGNATLQITVDGDLLVLAFVSPLDNLVGFERPPRNDKERDALRRMASQLDRAEQLFVPSTEARCTRTSVSLDSPVIDRTLLAVATAVPERAAAGQSQPATSTKGDTGHAALSADIAFRCQQPARLSGIEVNAFDVFPRLKRVDVQVAGPKKQSAAKVTARDRRVSW